MKKTLLGCLLAMCVALGGGCSINKISMDMTSPPEYDIQETKIYRKPYDKVWKAVVESIGSSYFVLENIEKDSGILSLSFSTQTPKDLIDCGTVIETGTIQMQKYSLTYDGTETNLVKKLVTKNGIPGESLRKFSLSGKANVLVQSVGKNETKVTVKTRYVVELGYTHYIQGALAPVKTLNTMHFTGKETGQFDTNMNIPSLQCRSKGTLEMSIFNGIEKHL